jgi:hypothetical protein
LAVLRLLCKETSITPFEETPKTAFPFTHQAQCLGNLKST